MALIYLTTAQTEPYCSMDCTLLQHGLYPTTVQTVLGVGHAPCTKYIGLAWIMSHVGIVHKTACIKALVTTDMADAALYGMETMCTVEEPQMHRGTKVDMHLHPNCYEVHCTCLCECEFQRQLISPSPPP